MFSTQSKYAIIINSFWSHNSIAYLCKINNIIPIHLYSSVTVANSHPGRNSVALEYFHTSLVFNNMEQFLDEVKNYNIKFVYSCTDEGVLLAYTLSKYFGIIMNDECLEEKLNKFKLYIRLGQPASDKNFKEFSMKYGKCVIKPANIELSGGCAGVRVVDNSTHLNDVENYFISSFFEGDEFAIDLVSINGKHKLISVWKYIKSNNNDCWKDKAVLLEYEKNKNLILNMYSVVESWLNLIQHKNGPTHIELKYNGHKFFCIEINFRLHGHLPYQAIKKSLSITQPDLTFSNLTNSIININNLSSYTINGYISKLYYVNSKVRKDSEISWNSIINSESVIKLWKHSTNDQLLLPESEKSFKSSLAILVLLNSDEYQLQKDEDKVLKLFE